MDLSRHAQDELARRQIPMAWVWRAVEAPDYTEPHADGTVHYIARLPGPGERYLRVVVNRRRQPHRVATVFVDARLSRRAQAMARRLADPRQATEPPPDT